MVCETSNNNNNKKNKKNESYNNNEIENDTNNYNTNNILNNNNTNNTTLNNTNNNNLNNNNTNSNNNNTNNNIYEWDEAPPTSPSESCYSPYPEPSDDSSTVNSPDIGSQYCLSPPDRYLLDPMSSSSRHTSPMLYAASHGDLDTLAQCLESEEYTINDIDLETGSTALHKAAARNHVSIMRFLIEKGASSTVTDGVGSQPIHYAAAAGSLDALCLLANRDQNANVMDGYGYTPFHLATRKHHFDLASTLISLYHADINATSMIQKTALHSACERGDIDGVDFLLKNKAMINICDNAGRTPLLCAVNHNHSEIVRRLLHSGADLSLVDNEGRTILHKAVMKNRVEILKCISSTCSPDKYQSILSVRDNRGSTAAEIGLSKFYMDAVDILVMMGANLSEISSKSSSSSPQKRQSKTQKLLRRLSVYKDKDKDNDSSSSTISSPRRHSRHSSSTQLELPANFNSKSLNQRGISSRTRKALSNLYYSLKKGSSSKSSQ